MILSRQASLHHLDQTPAFVRKLAFQKQQLEAQAAFEEINQQAKVTPEELQQYYTAHAADYDEIMVRQFVIRKKAAEPKADPAHPTRFNGPGTFSGGGESPRRGHPQRIGRRHRHQEGHGGFQSARDVIIEAEPRKIRRGGMRPDMEKVAFALKDGEVSEPVDVPQALVFFQVTGHSHVGFKGCYPGNRKDPAESKRLTQHWHAVKKNATVWMDDQYFAAPPKHQERPTMGAPAVMSPPKP